jgi:hypothetical protein
MPIKPPRFNLNSEADWDRWARETFVSPSPQSVTPTELAPEAVTTSAIAGAAVASDDRFYVKRSGGMVLDVIVDADCPSTLTRDSEMAAADAVVSAAFAAADSVVTAAYIAADAVVAADAAVALAAHVSDLDPHPGYLTAAEGNAAYQPLAAALSMLHTGTGSPEGALGATVGHLYLRSDGGANTTLYVKESGSGNTGWIAK